MDMVHRLCVLLRATHYLLVSIDMTIIYAFEWI
jgi:hypothetical protein